MEIKKIAEMCLEVNRIFCESTGDYSQTSWEDAEARQIESVIEGINFVKQNPGITPENCHKNWLSDKKSDGWKYGDEMKKKKRKHMRGFSLFEVIITGIIVDGLSIILIFGLILFG